MLDIPSRHTHTHTTHTHTHSTSLSLCRSISLSLSLSTSISLSIALFTLYGLSLSLSIALFSSYGRIGYEVDELAQENRPNKLRGVVEQLDEPAQGKAAAKGATQRAEQRGLGRRLPRPFCTRSRRLSVCTREPRELLVPVDVEAPSELLGLVAL